jgi:transposase InsO family protein
MTAMVNQFCAEPDGDKLAWSAACGFANGQPSDAVGVKFLMVDTAAAWQSKSVKRAISQLDPLQGDFIDRFQPFMRQNDWPWADGTAPELDNATGPPGVSTGLPQYPRGTVATRTGGPGRAVATPSADNGRPQVRQKVSPGSEEWPAGQRSSVATSGIVWSGTSLVGASQVGHNEWASCFDDAAVESWHSTLEFELLSRHRFATKAEARREVARFIEWYNRARRHSTCEGKSPVDYEALLAERAVKAAHEADAA